MRVILLVVLLALPGCAALKSVGFLTGLGGAASNGINADAEVTIGKPGHRGRDKRQNRP